MFLSVKERAQQLAQLANGQTPTPTTTAPTTPASKKNDRGAPSKSTPSKIETSKAAPSWLSKPEPSKTTASSSRTAPSPKVSSPKAASPKAASPKITPPKAVSSKPVPLRTVSAQVLPSKTAPSTPSTPSKRSKSPKSPKSPKAEKPSTSKSSSRPKLSRSKTAPSKLDIGSFAESSDEDESPTRAPSDIDGLKAACLKQANGITGLSGRSLAVVCRQTSAGGWYAALKDTSLDKYLKMWMNRSKTFPTQLEALQSYLVFVKKMKAECRLFPMSPKLGSKSK